MKLESKVKIPARRFPVTVKDGKGCVSLVFLTLTKEQLTAAEIVGQSSKEFIHRICNRSGLEVLDIATPERKNLYIDLNEIWEVKA